MILVIGGHSKIGSALVGELISRGETVRALFRPAESDGSSPGVPGYESVTGDLADVESLRAAMVAVERVFLICSPTEEEVQLNRNAIDVAKESGVKLFVRSSILGSDPDSRATFVRDHGICDRYLRDSGVPHAIVRPNLFMQNVPESTIPAIDENDSFYINAGDARISMVDTRDVAAVAATLLSAPPAVDKAYDVTGPAALSYADVAATLSVALDRTIKYVDVPDEAVAAALAGFGMAPWFVSALVDLYQDYRRSGSNGYAAQVTDTVRQLTGQPARTLEQLLAEQLAA